MKTRKFLRTLCTGILIGAVVMGCENTNTAYKEQKIITVGENVINLDEMMYHVMIAYQLYYEAAKAKGLSLDEGEKEQVLETIKNMKNNIGSDAMTKTQLTDDEIQSITEKIALATKYYREQIAAASIDEGAIKGSIDKAAYEEQKLQYLFIPTNRKVGDGKVEEVDEKTLEGIKQKLQDYRQQFASINKVDKLTIAKEDQGILQSGEIAFDKENHPFGEEVEIVAQYEAIGSPDMTTPEGFKAAVKAAKEKFPQVYG